MHSEKGNMGHSGISTKGKAWRNEDRSQVSDINVKRYDSVINANAGVLVTVNSRTASKNEF